MKSILLNAFFCFLVFVEVFAQDMNPEAGRLYNEGNSYLKSGNYSEAIKYYDKAITIERDYRIYYQRGVAQKKAEDLNASKSSFEECLRIKSDFEPAYNALGGVYFSMGDYYQAITNFEKVLTLTSNHSVAEKVKKNLSLSYTKLGNEISNSNSQKAIEYFNKAVSYDNYDAAYLSLAKLYADLGEWDKSISAAENALKYQNKIPIGGPYFYMGVAYKGKGNISKAKEMFEKSKMDETYSKTASYELSLLQFNNNYQTTNINNNVEEKRTTISSLPPIISIEDIFFSTGLLRAGETATLSIEVKNSGPGDAEDVYVQLTTDQKEISYPSKTTFNKIPKDGGAGKVNIDITGSLDLPTAQAYIDIKLVEPNFKVSIQGKRLIFNTQEFRKPELVLAKFAVLENQSSSPNNRIDINEMIDVNFAIQNVGVGNAESVEVSIENNQKGVMFLGVKDLESLKRENPKFSQIEVGKYETVTYTYFVNSEFTEKELKFSIIAKEKFNKFNLKENKSVPINTTLKEEGFIRQVTTQKEDYKGNLKIENIPDFVLDIEQIDNIPAAKLANPNAIAIILGIEKYRNIQDVPFATRDALWFKEYAVRLLGVSENKNSLYFKTDADVTKGEFEKLFSGNGWLSKRVNEESEIYIYYAGHGAPDLGDKSPYLIPYDGDPNYPSQTGFQLKKLYEELAKLKVKSITIFIDACFSGGTRENTMIFADARPVYITVEDPAVLSEALVVFTASTGDQISSSYPEKNHGLFTYYLLKGFKGEGDLNSDDQITIEEMEKYLQTNVSRTAGLLDREQTPQVFGKYKSRTLISY